MRVPIYTHTEAPQSRCRPPRLPARRERERGVVRWVGPPQRGPHINTMDTPMRGTHWVPPKYTCPHWKPPSAPHHRKPPAPNIPYTRAKKRVGGCVGVGGKIINALSPQARPPTQDILCMYAFRFPVHLPSGVTHASLMPFTVRTAPKFKDP